MLEHVVLVRPMPWFSQVKREIGLSGGIWFVDTPYATWVGQSLPAISRAMCKAGEYIWSSTLARLVATNRCSRGITCRRFTAVSELNRALVGRREAFFVVRDPDCWEIEWKEERDAAFDLGT